MKKKQNAKKVVKKQEKNVAKTKKTKNVKDKAKGMSRSAVKTSIKDNKKVVNVDPKGKGADDEIMSASDLIANLQNEQPENRDKREKAQKIVNKAYKEIIHEEEISERIEKNMPVYGASLIIARALCDIDGLKPIQRKILWSLYQLGGMDKLLKSSMLTGDIQGKYSPHADSYDSVVLLTREREGLLTPLIKGKGSFGKQYSRDTAPSASRYCVTGETVINTQNGFIKIEDLVKNSKLNSEIKIKTKIKSFDKNYSISKFFNSGEHPIYKITAKNGMSIKGTGNHPLLCIDKEFNLVWKTLEKIKLGDKVLVDTNDKLTYFGKNNDLLEAKMLGCMISEGYITTENRIGINNTDFNMIKPVKEFFEKKYGKKVFANKRIGKNSKQECYEYVVCCSKQQYDEFVERYEYKNKAKDKRLPSIALKGTKEYLATLLRYLYEGDGSIDINLGLTSNKDRQRVNYSSISEGLIEDIQILLSSAFGIHSTRQIDKRNNAICLTISESDSLIKFVKEIGFVSKRKNDKLKEIKIKKPVANCSGHIEEMADFICSKNNKIKRRITCKSEFNKYEQELLKYIKKEDVDYIKKIIDNYKIVEIKDKKRIGKEVVYSVKVDSDFHAFSSNGFISHNTEVKLEPICHEMLDNVKKVKDNFKDNYSKTLKEPINLICAFPLLLANENNGVAYSLSSEIGSFNLNELCEATEEVIKNYKKDNKELYKTLSKIMPTFDFTTGCEILLDKNEMKNIYLTGDGKISCRATFTNNEKDKVLEIRNIPYTTTLEAIIDAIMKAYGGKRFEEISRVVDGTDADGLKIVVEYKRGTDVKELIKKLLIYTPCQENFNSNIEYTYNNNVRHVGVIDTLKDWIEARRIWLKKEFATDLEENKHKLNLLEGLQKILLDIDKAIKIVRQSKTDEEVINGLMKAFKLDNEQAEFVANIKLRNLNKDYILNKIKEIKDLKEEIKRLEKILKGGIDGEMIKQLEEIKKKYGYERKSKIITEWEDIEQQKAKMTEKMKAEAKEKNKASVEGNSILFTNEDSVRKVSEGSSAQTPSGFTKNVVPNAGEIIAFTNKCKVFKWGVSQLKANNITKIADIKKIAKKLEAGEHIIYTTPLIEDNKMVVVFENKKAVKFNINAYKTEKNYLCFKKGLNVKNGTPIYLESISEDKDITVNGKIINTAIIKEVDKMNGSGAKIKI